MRKILRSGETAFVYERSVQPQPKIGPWKDELDRLLAVNAARSSRERLTLIRVFEELRGLGYEAGTTRCGGMRPAGSASGARRRRRRSCR